MNAPGSPETVVTVTSSASESEADAPLPRATPSRRGTVLYLYSGPPGREDGLAAELANRGLGCTEIDKLVGDDCDLLEEALWTRLETDLRAGRFQFVVMSPPCVSFALSRGVGPGPRVLRTPSEPYGIRALQPPPTEAEATPLREGSWQGVQTFELVSGVDRSQARYRMPCTR